MPFDFIKESARVNQSCRALSISPTPSVLIVSIRSQQMAIVADSKIVRNYSISTSKNPPSCLEDSFGTPTGLHRIADKIGAAAALGTVFKGRVDTLTHFSEFPPDEQSRNLITTRILRLCGLEEGINSGKGCDSYERYIYIHGTNHEDRIGEPFSGGCVELDNKAVIDLFNRVETGDLVWITDS